MIASLKPVLAKISQAAGQRGRIQGVYIEVEDKFALMLNYASARMMQNNNPKRVPCNILMNSCIHFVKGVIKSAGVKTPWMLDPRPNSYIGEFKNNFLDLEYVKGVLKIETKGSF